MKTWKLGYEKAKRKAQLIYSQIGTVTCSRESFDGVIVFNNVGFSHLMRKGKNPRARNEQKKRFVLIPYIRRVLESSEAAIVYRKESKDATLAEFWTFVDYVDKCKIKVVIRQVGRGHKHFFSVMGDNVKIEKKKSKNKKPRN